MSTLIRKLAWSRLSDPRVAVAVSASGLLLGMLVGATAPNAETLPIKLPLSYLLPSLSHQHVIATPDALTLGHPRLASGWPGCCGRTARAGAPTRVTCC